MKKRNILLSSLAVFALGMSSVSALEVEEGWTLYEKDTTKVAIDKFAAFEEALAKRVEDLNLSSIASNTNELYRYRIEASETEEETYKKVSNEKTFDTEEEANSWALENEPEEDGWSFIRNIVASFKLDKILDLLRVETKEEAELKKAEFDKTVDEDSEKATITEIYDEEGNTTEKVDDTRKFYDFGKAQTAANELFNDNHDFKVEAIVKAGEAEFDKTVTEDIVITEYFSTQGEAQAYIDSLEVAGYTVNNPQIIPVTHEEKFAEIHKNDYTSLEEAQNAYDNFVTTNKGDDENVTITGDGVTSKLNPDKDVVGEVVRGTEAYTSIEDYEAAKNNLPANVEGIKREETKIVDQKVYGDGENEISLVFDNEVDAINHIESLRQQGYDVSGLTKELVSFEESVWENQEGVVVNPGTSDNTTFSYGHFDVTLLTSFTKIDAEGNRSTVTGTVAINSVKINNKSITMEGPSKDPNEGYTEYTSKERNNLSVTNRSLVEVTGTVTFNGTTLPFTVSGYLSESQNACGGRNDEKGYDLKFESITIVNNRVVVDTNIVNQYKIKGTAVKTATVYYLDTRTTTLGYDYMVDVEAYRDVVDGYNIVGTKSKDLYKNTYVLDVTKTIYDYDYEVQGKGIKTYYDVISEYVKLADVEWIIESMELGKGGDVEVLPPQTGVADTNTNLPLTILISIMAGLFLIIKKFI